MILRICVTFKSNLCSFLSSLLIWELKETSWNSRSIKTVCTLKEMDSSSCNTKDTEIFLCSGKWIQNWKQLKKLFRCVGFLKQKLGSRCNPRLHPSIHLPPLSSRNYLRAVARDHVWLNPDLSIDPGGQSVYSLIQRSMSAFLSFSHGIPAPLPTVDRGHKEQDFAAGHRRAEASTGDHIHFSWCNGNCTLFFVAGYEVCIVIWGGGRVEVREGAPAWRKMQESLLAVPLAKEAGCSHCLQLPFSSPVLGHPSAFPPF